MPENERYISALGESGFVGSMVVDRLKDGGYTVIAPTHLELDITHQEQVEVFLGANDSPVVVNFVGYTNVDGAQSNQSASLRLNTEAVEVLARICRDKGKKLIHISSDYVFPGTVVYQGPYSEDDQPAPLRTKEIGEYGRSKLWGELAIQETKDLDWTIIRIASPFGDPTKGSDYIRKILLATNRGYRIITNQRITPTFLPDLAKAVEAVVKNNITGRILHVASPLATTPIQVARYTNYMLGLPEPIPGTFAEIFDREGLSPRPQFGGLAVEKTQELLGITFTDWRDGIDAMIRSGELVTLRNSLFPSS